MDAKEQINKIKEALGLQKTEKTINLAQIAKVNKWYIEVEGDTFAVGNKVIRKWWDNETEPLEAGEYELNYIFYYNYQQKEGYTTGKLKPYTLKFLMEK